MNIKLDLYIEGYSAQKALLWGNFIDHCKKAKTTTGWNRTFHLLIAIAEAAPIISQIVSIFENIIVKKINPNGLLPKTKNESVEKKIQKIKSDRENKYLPKDNGSKTPINECTIHTDQSNILQLNKKNTLPEQGIKPRKSSANLTSSSDHIHQPPFIEDLKVDLSTQNPPEENKKLVNLNYPLNKNTPVAIKKTRLNEKELRLIQEYYIKNLTELEKQTEPVHIRKDKKNQLPRSLVYVPNGPRSGMYILLKTKNNIKEIGYGGMCRVTRAFHLDSGTLKAFRSAKKRNISPREIKANKLLNNKLKFFAAGVAVTYQGTWRKRGYKKDKASVSQEKDVKKAAFIMDFFKGGDLFDYKFEKKLEKNPSECIRLGKKIAKTIDALHKENLVHHDLKPENIILTDDNKPKLADFGFTAESDTNIPLCGTEEFIAPELWKKGQLKSNPAVDIWALGCILAFLKNSPKKNNLYWWHTKNVLQKDFEESKKIHLKNRKNPKSLDYIINKCLRWDPERRPSSEDVVKMFKEVDSY